VAVFVPPIAVLEMPEAKLAWPTAVADVPLPSAVNPMLVLLTPALVPRIKPALEPTLVAPALAVGPAFSPIEVELAPTAEELAPTAKELSPVVLNAWQAALVNKLGAATLPEAHCARASVDKAPAKAAAIANAAQVFDEKSETEAPRTRHFLPPLSQP
jgi:hypothetical protein